MEVLIDLFFRYWELTVFVISATFAFFARFAIYTYIFGVQKYIYGVFYKFDKDNELKVLMIKLNPKYKFYRGWTLPYAPYGIDKFHAFRDLCFDNLGFKKDQTSIVQDILTLNSRYVSKKGLRELGPKKQYTAMFTYAESIPNPGLYAAELKFFTLNEFESIVNNEKTNSNAKWIKNYEIILKELRATEIKLIEYNN